MEFDNNKVLTPFTENKEKWIGWRGFGSDSVATLKNYIKNYPGVTIDLHCLSDINDEDDIAVCNYPYRLVNVEFRYFYPIEPPAEKPTYRPCRDMKELMRSYLDIEGDFSCEYLAYIVLGKAVREKRGHRTYVPIGAVCEEEKFVRIEGMQYGLQELFDSFTWADDRPIGMKE